MREENKKEEEKSQTEISNIGRSNKSWSSNAQNMKETDLQDNMEVTRRTGLVANYQGGRNIPAKGLQINLSEKTDNLIMIYNETTTKVYVEKQETIKPKSSNKHNTGRPDIYLDNPKQEGQRKGQGEQEVRKT